MSEQETPPVSPMNGGCWICETKEDGVWKFDTEFDTYYHESCLDQTPYNSILDYESNREPSNTIEFSEDSNQ